MCDGNNLVWIDLEMTGLNPEQNRIIEIATVVTDSKLNVLSEGPVLVIYQTEAQLSLMDAWNMSTHSNSGLLQEVRLSVLNEEQASNLTIEFLRCWASFKQSPICGNTVGQDRRFLFRYMPKLEEYFNHRYLDVSSLRELMIRWRPDLKSGLKLHKKHRALEDIYASVSELKFYRNNLIKLL